MRYVIAVLATTFSVASPLQASAERPGVTVAFGNTVKALYADGKYQRLWFRADGSWEAVGRRGKRSSGRWSLQDQKVCLLQSRPFPAPFRYCTAFPASGALGVVWTSQDWQGEPIKLTIVKGIERP